MSIVTASKTSDGWIATVRCPECDSGTVYPIGVGELEKTSPDPIMRPVSEARLMDQFVKDHDCEKDNREPSWAADCPDLEYRVMASLISRLWTPSTRLG